MEYLELLTKQETWEKFYGYCAGKDHITGRELKELRRVIDQKTYERPLNTWLREGTFPYASKRVINKLGNDRKRIVYSFPTEVNMLLKALSYHLHEYDGLFAPNLFSFRVNRSVKTAVAYLTGQPDIRDKYVYKLDIHDYFNSVDVEQMLPMVYEALPKEPLLCRLITDILTNPYVYDGETVIREKKGIMAGIPLSSFLANLYLSGLDRKMLKQHILYARYSDDIIVFADSAEQREQYRELLHAELAERGLTVNPKKVEQMEPHEKWTFLGVTYRDGTVDVSEASVDKLKGKMKRKARKLYRWRCRNGATAERAIRAYIKHYNAKFYDNRNENELTWARWFFPVITTTDSLRELDRYMVECIRFIATGKYTKANYNLRYGTIKEYGFRSLVNEYYRDRGEDLPKTIKERE